MVFAMFNSENEIRAVSYESFNQKFLTNGGVSVYFGNVFTSPEKGKLPTIKHKLRKILVDFGMCQTCMEINQELNYIKVWYQDFKAMELKEFYVPFQRFNDKNHKSSQAIEISMSLEGGVCSPPKITRGIKTYTGLTKLLFQEFIQLTESRSLSTNDPFNEIKEVIRKGNLAASEPLCCIFRGEVG